MPHTERLISVIRDLILKVESLTRGRDWAVVSTKFRSSISNDIRVSINILCIVSKKKWRQRKQFRLEGWKKWSDQRFELIQSITSTLCYDRPISMNRNLIDIYLKRELREILLSNVQLCTLVNPSFRLPKFWRW